MAEEQDKHPAPEDMVVTKPGEPYPEIMIELSNGMLVPESKFGAPPPEMPISERDAWYRARELQLISGGDQNG